MGCYDIVQFAHLLNPVEGKRNEYYCPVCGAENFKIGKGDPTPYQCFAGLCEPKNIRAAIDKLAGKVSYLGNGRRPKLEPGTLEARIITRKAAALGAFDSPEAWMPDPETQQSTLLNTETPIAEQAKPEKIESSEVSFFQIAEKELYGDRQCICYMGTLYQWAGNHYKEILDEADYPRIKQFCENFAVKKLDKEGKEKTAYPFSKPTYVRQVLDWVKLGVTVTSEQVNPPGINCKNGILLLRWEGTTLITELVPHSSDHYHLCEPKVKYDPQADSVEYERLMQCLDPVSREIWERTIAASLDLPTVRKHRGRAVRALLQKGDGSNGKDTLRLLVQTVLGSGVFSSCSVSDFQQYDQGRAFPIYPLRGKLVNWPSENADVGRIDQLRGLRAAITGDPITFEAKHKMPVQEFPKAVFLFNINESPNLLASLKATASRWGIIPFKKTFGDSPASGELQADPRFKEDPAFLAEKIAPAFLNRLLVQLQAVVDKGIDYSGTQELLNEIQRESSHLLQFARDSGLQVDSTKSVTVAELWQRLKQWYIDNGTLIIENPTLKDGKPGKDRLTWVDQVRRGDRNVKGPNQIIPRFLELFPKSRRSSCRQPGSNNPESILTGINFQKTEQRDQHEKQNQDAERNIENN
jgi:putative DNA primase/helicase